MIVVADSPATDLVDALVAAGAFPIVETTWADAPTAFNSVKPTAVVIAEPGAPASEVRRTRCSACRSPPPKARSFRWSRACTATRRAAVPIALAADAALPVERLIARLQSAMRVRALHATVLRRIETFGSRDARLPPFPIGDALDDATVLIAGRGPLYPKLSVAMGERVKMLGALSVEAAAKHLNARDIDGIVVGDGFSRARWRPSSPCWRRTPASATFRWR